MRVGFIGVGNIGLPMADQIQVAGYSMVVHDVRREAAASLIERGAEWADSPGGVAEMCDVVCTCLPGPVEMEQVTLGEGGLVQGLRAGSVYIDHTTNSPELVKKVHGEVVKRGAKMLDAPVSGGKEGAQTRDLTVLVGGDTEVLEEVRPILDAMAKTVMHVGAIGSGCVGKVLHNCAIFSLEQAMVECLTLGVKAGVDPAVMVEVFQKAALGRNMGLHVRLPATLFQGDFDPRFALKIAYKDMSLATEMARLHEVPMAVTEATERAMAEAMDRGWADRDSSIFLTLQEELAGVQVRV
jgi:3-hydroxyisobutyrate dehydrogenase